MGKALMTAVLVAAAQMTVTAKDFVVGEKTGAAIQGAVDAAAKAGGGRVVVPPGEYQVGSLRLRSKVELRLEEGAVLSGGTRSTDYFSIPDEVCPIRPEGSGRVLLYAWDERDIAVTGKGVIDCHGPAFFGRSVRKRRSHWSKPACERPRIVQFVRCRGVRMEGVTLRDSPNWTVYLRRCEDISIDGLRVVADQRIINSDGIHLDGCRRVRITRSFLRTGDDCIVARAIRAVGNDEPIVCEDIEVTDCELDSTCQCIRLGCPSDDTVRNVIVRNVKLRGRNGIRCENPARYLHPGDEGYLDIRNCTFENVTGELSGVVIQISVDPGIKLRAVKDIAFRNIGVRSRMREPLSFVGNVHTRFENVTFENVTVNGVRQKDGEVPGDYAESRPLERPGNCLW